MTVLLYLYLFIMGTAIGSFLNVLADRLPNDEGIHGRSHCDSCKKTLAPVDLIPIFSFLMVKGKCRYCKSKLSFFYPFVEILTGVIWVLTWMYTPVVAYHGFFLGISQVVLIKAMYLGLMSALIVIIFADLKYHIIPDAMQIALFLFSCGILVVEGSGWEVYVGSGVNGIIVMVPILLLFLGTRGRGMGFGDVKLAFVIGFMLGVGAGFVALYIAFILGAVYGVVLILLRLKKMKSQIAFGPFLVLGIIVMLFFSSPIMEMVMNYFKF